MKLEELYNAIKGMDMNARCIEGRVGDCEIKVGKTSFSIGGVTYYPKKR